MPRRLLAILGLLMVFVASGGLDRAVAAARICRQLESELAGGGGARFSAEKYDAAIVRQRDEMAVAEGQRTDAGCGFAIIARNVRQCAALNGTIARMKRNLQVLQRDRRAARGGVSAKDRIRLLEALDANDCRNRAPSRPPDREAATEPPLPEDGRAGNPQPLEALLGGRQDSPVEEPSAAFPGEREDSRQSFRTMCVRTCDGYFFPMSAASTVGDFDRDQENCETACPETDMRVYYGPRETDDPAHMLSTRDGLPYADLPTAFRHRRTSMPRAPACGCSAGKEFNVLPESPPPPGSATTRPPVDAEPKPNPGSIVTIVPPPATGKPKVAEQLAPTNQPRPGRDEGDRKVRVVGPKFLPDPTAAAAPPVPAQRTVP